MVSRTVSTHHCREGTGQLSSSSAGYVTIFVATLEALKEKTLLKVTENGPSMIEVINFLIKSVSTCENRDFLVGLISKLEACSKRLQILFIHGILSTNNGYE